MIPPGCTLSAPEIESLYVYGHRNADNLRKLCDQALLALVEAQKTQSLREVQDERDHYYSALLRISNLKECDSRVIAQFAHAALCGPYRQPVAGGLTDELPPLCTLSAEQLRSWSNEPDEVLGWLTYKEIRSIIAQALLALKLSTILNTMPDNREPGADLMAEFLRWRGEQPESVTQADQKVAATLSEGQVAEVAPAVTDPTPRTDIELLARLDSYNPPDRTIDEERHIAIDLQDASAMIKKLSRQVASEYVRGREHEQKARADIENSHILALQRQVTALKVAAVYAASVPAQLTEARARLALQLADKESWHQAAEAAMKDYITNGLSVTRIAPQDYLKESVTQAPSAAPCNAVASSHKDAATPAGNKRTGEDCGISPSTARQPAVTDPTPDPWCPICLRHDDHMSGCRIAALQRQVAELQEGMRGWQNDAEYARKDLAAAKVQLARVLKEQRADAQRELARVREEYVEIGLCQETANGRMFFLEGRFDLADIHDNGRPVYNLFRAKLKEGT